MYVFRLLKSTGVPTGNWVSFDGSGNYSNNAGNALIVSDFDKAQQTRAVESDRARAAGMADRVEIVEVKDLPPYLIASSAYNDRLAKQVNVLWDAGYTPCGGVIWNGSAFLQSVVRRLRPFDGI